MASAQVNAWLAVHRGLLDDVSPIVDGTPGDAALARMMLHRRRAVVAQVVDEFSSRLGQRFVPDQDNRALRPHRSVANELVTSKAAGSVAASVNGSMPPLLLERALLAEMEGRNSEARVDIDELLKAFPGFLSAAIASARLALIDEDPGSAIGSLVYVARELVHTREGSALLADALHAIGMHEAASRYDLATLICPDHAGSHGNDCAPVDMTGETANDPRMPAAFIIDQLSDGRSVCNDRGIYYVGHPTDGGSLAELMVGQVSSARQGSSAQPPEAAPHHTVLRGRLRHGLKMAAVSVVAVGRRILRIVVYSGIRGPLYLYYKRLPAPLRYQFNRYMLLPLRRWSKADWKKVPQQDWRSDIARARLRAGIVRIMQCSGDIPGDEGDSGLVLSERPAGLSGSNPVATELTQLSETGDLPPAAAEVLNNLVQRLRDSGSDAASARSWRLETDR